MKNNLKIYCLLVLFGALGAACESFLEEELVADVSASSYYTTATGLEDAVKATYSEMKPFFGPERGFTMMTFGTDVHMNGEWSLYQDAFPVSTRTIFLSPGRFRSST